MAGNAEMRTGRADKRTSPMFLGGVVVVWSMLLGFSLSCDVILDHGVALRRPKQSRCEETDEHDVSYHRSGCDS